MWQWRALLVFASFILLVNHASPSEAYCLDYMPLSSSELSMRVKQRLICDDLTAGARVFCNRSTLTMMPDGTLRVTGTDCKGKSWVVWSMCENGFATVWSADLDKNMRQDLIVVSRSRTDSTWEPGAQLLIVTFDGQGRPVPWQCKGFFEVDGRGVKDIVDLDADGYAEVVQQTSTEGFWITSLYEATDAHFKQRRNHGDRTFPLYSKFTFLPNRLPAKTGGRRPPEPNLANDTGDGKAPVFLRAISRYGRSNSAVLFISNGDQWTAGTQSNMAIVLDEPSGRRIAVAPTVESRLLLEEVCRRQIPFTVAKRTNRKEAARILWARVDSVLHFDLACKSGSANGTRFTDEYVSNELP